MKQDKTGSTSDSDSTAAGEPMTAGAYLKQGREAAGISIKDVAQRLRLSTDLINRLETDDYDTSMLQPVFIRGYLRAYARLVNISEDGVIKLFNKLTQIESPAPLVSIEEVPSPPQRTFFPHFSIPLTISIKDKTVRWITSSILVLLLVLAIFGWRNHHATMDETFNKRVSYTYSEPVVPMPLSQRVFNVNEFPQWYGVQVPMPPAQRQIVAMDLAHKPLRLDTIVLSNNNVLNNDDKDLTQVDDPNAQVQEGDDNVVEDNSSDSGYE